MANIPTPPLPERTKIWYVGWRLTALEYEFFDRATKIQNVWMLGTWLYSFFRTVAYSFRYAAGHCYAFDDLIRDIVKWVNGLVDGTVFRALLYWISAHFMAITEDGKRWVRYRFAGWDSQTSLFVFNPIAWYWNRLVYVTSWMQNFLQNPTDQVAIWVAGFAWWFNNFLTNPSYYVYGWVLEAHPWLKKLMLHPFEFIFDNLATYNWWFITFWNDPASWVEMWAKLIPGDVGWFIADPLGYVEYRIWQYTGVYKTPGWTFLETVLFYLLWNATNYLQRYTEWYKSKLCDIIMIFM